MDTRQSDHNYSFSFDPSVYTTLGDYWKGTTGTPSITGGYLQVNAAAATSLDQFYRGKYTFSALIPTEPVIADVRQFGLSLPAFGVSRNAAYFSVGTGVKATGTVTVVDYQKAILTAATQTLTISGAISDGETVTIDAVTYRFKDTTAQAFDVKIGASDAITLDNLKAAINASGAGDGSDYHTGTTAHPTVNATTNTDTTQVVAADTAGSAGNSIATTEAMANGSWGAATLAGGYDHLTITVNGTALVQGTDFTAQTNNNTTATNIATAIAALANVTAAANNAVVTITADVAGTAANAYDLATSSTAAATVSGATLSGGVDGTVFAKIANDSSTVTSQTIDFDNDWVNAYVEYEIDWRADKIQFFIDGNLVASFEDNSTFPAKFTLPIYINNAVSDNMRVNGLFIQNAEQHVVAR